jgi:hypothetical protein
VRALFAHLAQRFGINCEPMPEPGTAEWSNFYLFPGRDSAQKPMSASNHERIILDVFNSIDIVTRKITHEFRVFPAQAMYEMGVSLDVSGGGCLASLLLLLLAVLHCISPGYLISWASACRASLSFELHLVLDCL